MWLLVKESQFLTLSRYSCEFSKLSKIHPTLQYPWHSRSTYQYLCIRYQQLRSIISLDFFSIFHETSAVLSIEHLFCYCILSVIMPPFADYVNLSIETFVNTVSLVVMAPLVMTLVKTQGMHWNCKWGWYTIPWWSNKDCWSVNFFILNCKTSSIWWCMSLLYSL